MKTSLARIIKSFQTFATNHKQIEEFSTAMITDMVAKNWSYPLMWIDYTDISVSVQRGQVVITMSIYFLDRVERDESNMTYVMSSNLLKALDFITLYNDHECGEGGYGFYFSDTPSLSPIVLDFDDIVSGWKLGAVIQVGYSRNEDEIPD